MYLCCMNTENIRINVVGSGKLKNIINSLEDLLTELKMIKTEPIKKDFTHTYEDNTILAELETI